MRYLLIAIGIIFTVIGFIGVVMPLLPTTPFLLVAVICFAKSSETFHNWLINTKIYQSYVEEFKKNRGFTFKKKLQILLSLYIVIGFSIFMINHPHVRITLLILVICQTLFLFLFVKTLPKE